MERSEVAAMSAAKTPRERARRFFARPLESRRSGSLARRVPRWLWLLAALWLAWVTVLSDHSFWRIAQLKREIAQAEKDTKEIRKSTAALEDQVNDPHARKFHAEEIARTQHGWAAPDELVYRFRGDGVQSDSSR
jgi:cell division protein FtsB